MKYPEDFKDACRLAYPGWTVLSELLDEGAGIVGRYLDDNRRSGVSNETVLSGMSLQRLQEEARLNQARWRLYEWWSALYTEQSIKGETE